MLNFILAGRDTTAWAMTSFIYMMCQHPEVRQPAATHIHARRRRGLTRPHAWAQVLSKLRAELAEVLGESRAPSYAELERMTYLEACMMECQRLLPSVPMGIKFPLRDDQLPDGTTANRGDMIIYSNYVMGRLKKIWGADALEFKPERWLTCDGIGVLGVSDCKFPAFNVGKRNCLGKPMAILETKLLMSTILQRYSVEMIPGHSMQFNLSATLTFTHGLHVKLTKLPGR